MNQTDNYPWICHIWCRCFITKPLKRFTMEHHNNNNNNNNNNNRIERRNSRFFTISSLLREPSLTRTLNWPRPNRVQITWNTSSAYHVQHVVLRAKLYEGTAQLLSLTELKSHLSELYFTGWTINWQRRGGNRSTRRKPLATNFRKCHILKPEDSSPKRLKPTQ